MLIKILMGIFALLMIGISYYLSIHINDPFIKIDQTKLTQYKITTKAIVLLFAISGIFSAITIFMDNKMLSLSALLFGSICSAYYALFISNKINI